MPSVSHRSLGFSTASVYRHREPHAFTYLSERATFWIAIISVFAFVTGNMIGQHGWHVFWKSVMGEGSETTIAFTGMVPPITQIPDIDRWAKLGGNVRTDTFRQIPKDLLVPLPAYIRHGDSTSADSQLRRVYFTEYLGTYETGRGKGSHAGVDISAPEGTPIVAVANGVVFKVGYEASGFGNYVVLKHPNVPDVERKGEKSTIYSVYAHLSSAVVDEGTVVQKGEQIALSGKTGFATAPHLHFQMDLASAPFHPYWPFNSADQRKASVNFTQAIDMGLGRENAVQHMIDPMVTVQAYEVYTGPVFAAAPDAPSAAKAATRSTALTIADRRASRIAKAGVKTTLVAYTENAPVIPIPTTTSSAGSATSVWSQTGIGTVAGVQISHEGSFSSDRGWKTVTLTLLDAKGKIVTVPSDNKKIYLKTAFGQAEFKPATVSPANFKKGVLQVQMLPLANQTVVVQAEPYGSLSVKAVKFQRN